MDFVFTLAVPTQVERCKTLLSEEVRIESGLKQCASLIDWWALSNSYFHSMRPKVEVSTFRSLKATVRGHQHRVAFSLRASACPSRSAFVRVPVLPVVVGARCGSRVVHQCGMRLQTKLPHISWFCHVGHL